MFEPTAHYEGTHNIRTALAELRSALPNPEQYRFDDVSEYGGTLVSKHCVIEIDKDRYGEQSLGISIRRPNEEQRDSMSLYILRHMRRAYEPARKTENMVYYGRLIGEFFPDLLAGDFALKGPYSWINSDFNYQFLDLLRLPPDHRAVQLCRQFDIRWMQKVGLYGRLCVWLPRGIGQPNFRRTRA